MPMDDVGSIIRTRASTTQHCIDLLRRDGGDDAVERLIKAEMRTLFDIAVATLGRDRAYALVHALAA